MGIFAKLFGRKSTEADTPAPPRDIEALTGEFYTPAVHLIKTEEKTASFLGGSPIADNKYNWPQKDDRPLTFIAQLDLRQLNESSPTDWLPNTGSLIFFYDSKDQPWGFDPKDAGGWHVEYLPELEGSSSEIPVPASLNPDFQIAKQHLRFKTITVLPSMDRDAIFNMNFSSEERDIYTALQSRPFNDEPKHQLSGYPYPIQNDQMENECQLASNGLYCGDGKAYSSSRGRQLLANPSDWRLLLQIDTDDDLDIMWGDSGMIYFWIKQTDALEKRFDKTWVILQCH